ncbi:Putative NADH:ubiquinone oxidoreductase, B16.6 subunit [Rhizopus microsporus]|uniref:NADH dehydrogenase [ubiquinone] 1 alpha subcomplex subunit 13 n=2 Tax=Rhizopus microsporus TaxID=58291 RepID=A0A2G4STC5_RHIZD|nr:B16.6 subunit of GRIM-19, NADH:ubiquinone oxidoreductase [Rhizopus microsporus ATCC 52813]ORE08139.1 GRIM-19 protein [Rhizopus microsporus var. microsporus]PHZ12004.1 B16.6 subunit of GRIM-19, NADH:ubiquinone oxidoreductase [Rhizopus microsporus ATCC 52813]CEG66249.1 Putative NADH:ubiquinone oxidoreductase, B16.6 subunit [Rhizopus microsporus]CEJ04342.1 Putative NADH:ubiquinone oxidoreductase, B16.6 subunit [Rhizopus microsporus]
MSNRTQDLPPQGGFPEIKYRRYLPKRGPSGAVLLSGLVALSAYGFYKVGEGNVEKRELKRENLWSRIHLVPLLTAEADRDAYRRSEAAKAREAEIMKNVEGWKVGESVYNNTKYYTPPNFVIVPEEN